MVGRVDKTTGGTESGAAGRMSGKPGAGGGAATAKGDALNWASRMFTPQVMSSPMFASMNSGRAPSNPMEMWLSLFPTAPMFGVRWALLDMIPGAGRSGAAAKTETAASSKTRAELEARRRREVETLSGGPRSAMKTLTATRSEPAADEAAPVAAHLRLIPGGAAATAAPIRAAAPKLLQKPAPAKPDDLKRIKGVGPKVEKLLNELGVHSYAQIAAFDDAVFAWLDPQLGTFSGRGKRDDWVGQAEALLEKRGKR